MTDAKKEFQKLVDLLELMRSPEGCAWDREQTLADFSEHLKNEADEVLEAIEREDYANLREELGDLLYNIVFIARIAEEQGEFNVADVCAEVREKIVRRHPHVFGGEKLSDPEEITKRWHEIKKTERK